MSAPNLSKFLTPNPLGVRELNFRALGTKCHVKIRLESERQALQFAADTLDWIKNFEEKYSRYLDTSLVSKINEAAGQSWIETDDDAEQLGDPLISGAGADPDSDHTTNEEEFIWGTDPLAADGGRTPSIAASAAQIFLSFTADAASGP
ncbi:MAG: hypothetical protein HN584_05605, partial [Akkermansiaceae bacterium]|nr:hypothetical protein [Akkermansiaceae bacterium]